MKNKFKQIRFGLFMALFLTGMVYLISCKKSSSSPSNTTTGGTTSATTTTGSTTSGTTSSTTSSSTSSTTSSTTSGTTGSSSKNGTLQFNGGSYDGTCIVETDSYSGNTDVSISTNIGVFTIYNMPTGSGGDYDFQNGYANLKGSVLYGLCTIYTSGSSASMRDNGSSLTKTGSNSFKFTCELYDVTSGKFSNISGSGSY